MLPQLRLIRAMILRQFTVGVATTFRVHLGLSSWLFESMSTGNNRSVETLWRDFLANTSEWWDHRPEKINPRFPDFKHKKTGESLWVVDAKNPQWVQAKLDAIPPGTVESDGFAWAQRLKRYVKARQYMKTMEAFYQLQQERISPSSWIFLPVLNACAGLRALDEGKRIHKQIIEVGCDSDVYVANCLVDMYSKCGSIDDAWRVFEKMQDHNVVSWNTMIGGYVKSGQGMKAMELFRGMQQEGVEPNAVSFIGVLNACASVSALAEGRCVHEQIIQRGCLSDVYVATCLVDMYAKCGSIGDAWSVFSKMPQHNVVSWNALIGGYVKSGQGLKALELFQEMQQEGVQPNTVSFVGVLNACASIVALEEGRCVHQQIIRKRCESDVFVANCLVDMYAKCGSIEEAWSVFEKMSEHNVISWNAMIGGYVKSGQGLKATKLFHEMQQEGVEPNTVTFVGVLNACASSAALAEGRHVHELIIHKRCESDVYVANCLVDMYAKCGSIEDAQKVFNKMPTRNVIVSTAMIRGYAMHGHAEKAIALFKRMGKEGVEIDEVTFTCLLSACSHGGLVEEGLHYFKSMSSCFNVHPIAEHYACMIDLLGRAGRLEEAEKMVKNMPVEGNVFVWIALLGACRIHGNIEMAERAAKQCWELDPEDASGHVLMSNIYAAAGKWDRSAAIGEERLNRKVGK